MKKRPEKFTRRRRKTREKRDRISLRKASDIWVNSSRKSREKTVSGSRRPSRKAGYSEELRGLQTEKAYGDLGYRSGMKKRPRRNLTLGNKLSRKERKRVTGRRTKDPRRVGKERVKQGIRRYWDRRNLERRKVQRKYRNGEKRKEIRTEKENLEKKELSKQRERYLVIRECERRRNQYERRSRYQTNARGKRRKEWWLADKYGKGNKGRNSDLRSRRKDSKEEEKKKLEERYTTRRKQSRESFGKAYEKRRNKLGTREYSGRKTLESVQRLRKRCEKTKLKPRQENDREPLRERPKEGRERELTRMGKKERELPFALPMTQGFAKRENLIRKGGRKGRQRSEEKKWRKVSEEERTKRVPSWTNYEEWVGKRTQKLEDENRKKLRKGESVDLTEATYLELGKRSLYRYGTERSERWKKKKKV
jgi:hypothetical protein